MARVLARDRAGALRPVALQSPEADALLHGMDEERRMASWHAVDERGSITSGGRAFGPLLSALNHPRAAALVERHPRLADRAYDAVANRRDLFGRLISEGAGRRARARVERSARGFRSSDTHDAPPIGR
jgi:predicted DCC family thiol-disulfide oxidoreductase YuxK